MRYENILECSRIFLFGSSKLSKLFPNNYFSKILLKPDDQLELNEAELKLEHTRILSARNPHAPDNLITFDFNAMNFTPGPAIEHMETNYKRMVGNFSVITCI